MQTIEDYASDLYKEIMHCCESDATNEDKEVAFTKYALSQLNDHNETDIAETMAPPSRWTKSNTHPSFKEAKINAWSISACGGIMELFVTLYDAIPNKYSVSKSDALKHFEFLDGFLERAFTSEFTVAKEDEAYECIQTIRAVNSNLIKIRLFFLTNGIIRDNILNDIKPKKLNDIDILYSFRDLSSFSRLRPGEAQTIDLDFNHYQNKPLPCICAEDAKGEYKTYLAYLPAPLIGKIFIEYGQRLLERNVRAFLSIKNSVNKGIQETLRNQPERFLAYNNGLCCTATTIKADMLSDKLGMIHALSDFQIVNGGQTTASIAHAIKNKIDVSNVVVQMKLTVVSNTNAIEQIGPNISRFANSQSKVLSADFEANGKFHRDLEKISQEIWAPRKSDFQRETRWYYERARGSYEVAKSMSSNAQKKIFEMENPRKQKFTKTDLAKFEFLWMGHPDIVLKGEQKNFVQYAQRIEENGAPDVTPEYFKQIIGRAILHETTKDIVTASKIPGLRANIVAYTIAWIVQKSEYHIDLDKIWKDQKVPNALCEAIQIVVLATRSFFNKTLDLGRPYTTDIKENTKRRECWELFRKEKIDLPKDWLLCLSKKQFLCFKSNADSLSSMWDDVRKHFVSSERTIKAFEIYTDIPWPLKGSADPVAKYASKSYQEMIAIKGVGEKKMKLIIDFFSVAK
jgi:hypothetical protein